jgi:hypothetical protein
MEGEANMTLKRVKQNSDSLNEPKKEDGAGYLSHPVLNCRINRSMTEVVFWRLAE